jgi:hypothetical protein
MYMDGKGRRVKAELLAGEPEVEHAQHVRALALTVVETLKTGLQS